MCGIYGMAALADRPLRAPELLAAMGRTLRHRGPDSRGEYLGRRAALGCERLRIIDRRDEADQPFADPGGRYHLVCNGEIYNAGDLRRRYADYPYRSHSDVETILPLFLDRGIDGLADLDGMFGLAIWDSVESSLVLARDRAGEKPLFYRRAGGEVWFASEVQALLVDPQAGRELDEGAVREYLALGYVREPLTTFRGVLKVEAGTVARFAAGGLEVRRYWDPAALAAAEPSAAPLPRLRELLRSAVRKQMAADVPLGIFVSGGLDSALLASIAVEEAACGGLHTFTVRFDAPSYDEGPGAAEWSRRLGAEHHEVVADERTLGEALAAISAGLAEPLADPAILPTYLLAREARRHVGAVLSGEGADELFGGYPTYLGHKLVPALRALPNPARRALGAAAGLLPASHGKVTFEFLLKRFLAAADRPWPERHLAWFGTGAGDAWARNGMPPLPAATAATAAAVAESDAVAGAMLLDYRTYLPDDLLAKIDRATMLNSLESRTPFLDRDLTAFALALPTDLKVRGLTTKWLLKRAAEEWLPRRLIHRKKRGLSVPVADWLDGGLRGEVDRLLAPERLARQDLLDPRRVGELLGEHRAGTVNHARPLWALVVFQYWLEHWHPERAGGGPPEGAGR